MAGTSKSVQYGDKNYESILNNWYEELESELSDYEDHRDEDFCPVSDHNSESEMEDSDEEQSEQNTDEVEGTEKTNQFYYGKNRYKWSAVSPNSNLNTRTKKHNIVKVLPGLKGPSKCGESADPLQIWSFLFTEEMENEIIQQTNEKIRFVRIKYSSTDRTELRELTKEEFRAFLAVLYFSAIFKSNDEDLEEIFSTDGTGRDIFRCIMSLKRVYILLACLRFVYNNTIILLYFLY